MNAFKIVKHYLYLTVTVLAVGIFFRPVDAFAQKPGAHPKKGQHPKKTHHPKKQHPKHKAKHVAHHHYKHLPKRGHVATSLPSGVIIVKHKGANFQYHNGVYYKKTGATSYAVVKAPRGMRVRLIPSAHKKLMVRKKAYLYYYGTFYVKVPDSKEYEIVEAPIGAEVDAIPEGYEMEEIDGVVYYTLDDVRYLEKEAEGELLYQVVK